MGVEKRGGRRLLAARNTVLGFCLAAAGAACSADHPEPIVMFLESESSNPLFVPDEGLGELDAVVTWFDTTLSYYEDGGESPTVVACTAEKPTVDSCSQFDGQELIFDSGDHVVVLFEIEGDAKSRGDLFERLSTTAWSLFAE